MMVMAVSRYSDKNDALKAMLDSVCENEKFIARRSMSASSESAP